MKGRSPIRILIVSMIVLTILLLSFYVFRTKNIGYLFKINPLIWFFLKLFIHISIIYITFKAAELIMKKDYTFILKLTILMTAGFYIFMTTDFQSYVCNNIDNVVQINIFRFLMDQNGIEYVQFCKELPANHFDKTYFAGFFNGTYNLSLYWILSKISMFLKMSPEFSVMIYSNIFLGLSITFIYLILRELMSINESMESLLVLLWSYENPIYFVRNGWFLQLVMTSIGLISIFLIIYVNKYSKNKKIILPLIIIITVFAFLNTYNIPYLIKSGDRLWNNQLDIYRIIYTINFLFVPAFYSLISSLFLAAKKSYYNQFRRT